MSQLTFGDAEYAGKRKTTRREVFLAEMDQVVPWKSLLGLIEPFYPMAGRGRQPYPLETMLRVHLMQNWFGLSDPAMEEALYEIASMREFARLDAAEGDSRRDAPSCSFRHLLEQHELAAADPGAGQRAPDAQGPAAQARHAWWTPRSSRRRARPRTPAGERDPEMHQTKKGNHWHFGMKAHIGVDADSGLVHTVVTTAANESDVAQVDQLLHGKEEVGARGCRLHRRASGACAEPRSTGRSRASAGRSKRHGRRTGEARASAKRGARRRSGREVEHPFRVIKRQFGYVKVRFNGLTKNTAQIVTLFALSNLWMARRQLMAMTG